MYAPSKQHPSIGQYKCMKICMKPKLCQFNFSQLSVVNFNPVHTVPICLEFALYGNPLKSGIPDALSADLNNYLVKGTATQVATPPCNALFNLHIFHCKSQNTTNLFFAKVFPSELH